MLLKQFFMVTPVLLACSSVAFPASQSAQSNQNFLNQQLQHLSNATGVLPLQDWFQHVQLTGLLNVDAFAQNNDNYLSPHAQFTSGDVKEGSQSGFNIATLALNLDAQVNGWISAHTSFFYATDAQPMGITADSQPERYYPAAEGGGGSPLIGNIDVDDAYVDVMNLAKSPIDIRVGRQYFGYGQYDRYAIMPTLTQYMTELRNTGVEVSYLGLNGFRGDVFAFRGTKSATVKNGALQAKDDYPVRNFGVGLGYTHQLNQFTLDVNGGYLYNVFDVGAFAAFVNPSPPRVGTWNVNASVSHNAWRTGIQYAAVINPLNTYGWDNNLNDDASVQFAKPSAGNLYVDYAFLTAGRRSKFNLSYQWSNQASTFAYEPGDGGADRSFPKFMLPESRVAAEYDVNVLQNTMLAFEVNFDSPYSKQHNGSGDNALTSIARLSVLM